MIDCIADESRHNKILNIGGPDDPITMKMQGEMIFNLAGRTPQYVTTPIWIFDVIINSLQWLADVTNSESLADAAETGRIGKYYAVEDMLTTDPSEKYGTISLKDHYSRLVAEGRPEDDPCTYIMLAMFDVLTLIFIRVLAHSLKQSMFLPSFYLSSDTKDALITRKQVANLMKVFV